MRGARRMVYAAIGANLAIAITKSIVAAATGSGAMFAEAIHSLVDTGDGLLLLLGAYLSHRPATRSHPYGRGLEVYFWSMVVAMVIFGTGGGVSIFEGIDHLLSPYSPKFSLWIYVVLAFAFVFEGSSWLVAIHEFHRERGETYWQAIVRSKDPTGFMIVLEDSAALVGIALAAIGVTLAHAFAAPAIDAVTSILIGVLLCCVAAILGRETWSLLVGESAAAAVVAGIEKIARAHPRVLEARCPRTLQLGPDLVHAEVDVRVDPSGAAGELLAMTREIEDTVRREYPIVKYVAVRFPAWPPS